MTDDPTIARIRAVRHQISEQYQHNVQRIINHYIAREQQHQARFIDLTASMPVGEQTSVERQSPKRSVKATL